MIFLVSKILLLDVIIKTPSSVQNCHEVNQSWTLPIETEEIPTDFKWIFKDSLDTCLSVKMWRLNKTPVSGRLPWRNFFSLLKKDDAQ